MRYEKLENLLQLAIEMQSARCGIALVDIQERFRVSRRTAQRMLAAVERAFPDLIVVPADGRAKRWHLPGGTLDRILTLTADEIGDLFSAAALLKSADRSAQAGSLERLAAKLLAVLPKQKARRIETDLEVLLESEETIRPPALCTGTGPGIAQSHIGLLREAMKACRVVSLSRLRPEAPLLLEPHGLLWGGPLWGERHYLVARPYQGTCQTYRPQALQPQAFHGYALGEIRALALTDLVYHRDPGFCLRAFRDRHFGSTPPRRGCVLPLYRMRACIDGRR